MTNFADIIRELDDLEQVGVIQRYAIAGAMAFLFYTEPVRTYDLDVFIFLPPQESPIVSMEPLYGELRSRGFGFDAEHVLMYDTPVQFLPAYNSLATEAVQQAVEHDYDGTPVRVISAEHLVALALQTGGKHRRVRAEALMDEDVLDHEKLRAILAAHGIQPTGGGSADG